MAVPIIIIIPVIIVSGSGIKIVIKKVYIYINLVTDIPSKDAYSVVSYGGNAKYSYRKDDQPSTSSVIKRDDSNSKYDEKSITYGYYGTNGLGSGNSFYNKTLN